MVENMGIDLNSDDCYISKEKQIWNDAEEMLNLLEIQINYK